MNKKKLLFVFNPRAGKDFIKYYLYDIIDIFVKQEYEVTVHPTQRRLDAYEQIKNRAGEYDLIVISGGDGSLNEAVKGLMKLERSKRPPIGYIPAGTTNDFASSIGISKDVILAAYTAAAGKPFTCDIGSFNNDTFIYVAAFGAFTDVSYDTPQNVKNALGQTAYLIEGIKRIPNMLKSHHIRVEYDGNVLEDDFVFGMVSNTTRLAGQKRSSELEISLNDGVFEAAFIRVPTTIMDLQNIITEMANHDLNTENIITFKTSHIKMTFENETPWTLDGEAGGNHREVEIKVNPKAVVFRTDNISVPPEAAGLSLNYKIYKRRKLDSRFRMQKKFKELHQKSNN
ncbi:MAG: YegS/Rv2252/BmrU family lipid kinase [Oscillospiraceae bacterium]|nr:YegS/Rv2252/BmrU family lipid kinase [Oscillospiraceae bacterium]